MRRIDIRFDNPKDISAEQVWQLIYSVSRCRTFGELEEFLDQGINRGIVSVVYTNPPDKEKPIPAPEVRFRQLSLLIPEGPETEESR